MAIMPASLFTWYGARELQRFGERGKELSGAIELNRFNRLSEMLESNEGTVEAAFRFRQDPAGWLIIELQYETAVHLVCQRCLGPFEQPLRETVEMALLESASLEQKLPAHYEPLVLEEDRLMPAMLIEDELIISLPIVPRHEHSEQCELPAARPEAERRS